MVDKNIDSSKYPKKGRGNGKKNDKSDIESISFGSDDLSSPRDKLIDYIKMDMQRDSRSKVGFVVDSSMMMSATYVASIEDCTQHRAIASISAIGSGVLYYLEKTSIDDDKYAECNSIIPRMLLSKARISEVISKAIIDKILFKLDGRSMYINMWDDVAGFISGFADRYHLDSHSVASCTFWIGLNKLITYEELYENLESSEEVMMYISISKTVIDQINEFNSCIIDMNKEGHLFHDI